MFPASSKEGGVHMTAGPLDACKTPTPGGPIPIPYANIVDSLAASGDEAAIRTKKNIIKGQRRKGRKPASATQAAIMSSGDEAGSVGGLASSNHKVISTFVGMPATRMTSMTSQSDSDSAPGHQISPSQSKVMIMSG